MIYMLKVNVLVAAVVFGFAGLLILAMFVWTEAKQYMHALRAMRRVARARREDFAISRMNSRNADPDSLGTGLNSIS
jgi:hypothetical protein